MQLGYFTLLTILAPNILAAGFREAKDIFVTIPESQTTFENGCVVFQCRALPGVDFQYSWTRNGWAIKTNTSRFRQVGPTLHVNNVLKDMDGDNYACIVRSSSGAGQASQPARLNVIWIKAANVHLILNTKAKLILKCSVDGSKDQEIEWLRNAEKLSNTQNIHMTMNQITIQSPSIYNNGHYQCIASNDAGSVMSANGFTLKLSGSRYQSEPTRCLLKFRNKKKESYLCRSKRGDRFSNRTSDSIFLEHPANKVIKENDLAEMKCKYNLPAKYNRSNVQLKWRKDGKVFRQTDFGGTISPTFESNGNMESILREDSRITLNPENGSLIFSAIIPNDAGQYQCQIFIEGYSPISSEIGELSVIEQLKFAPQPTSKNLELGSVGKVHCKAQGTPTPQVKWIRENSDELSSNIDDINGTLIFRNVSSKNRGNYTCIASNIQGRISASVSVGVVVAPKFVIGPEGIIYGTELDTVNFNCQAIGDPKPTIQWDKDLKYLSENNTDRTRFKFLENGTLQITAVHSDDEGRYGCTIGNSAGLKREEVQFIIKLPSDLEAEESSNGFIITRAVVITMSVALAYIILVVGLMLWCRHRRQARKSRLSENGNENIEGGEIGDEINPCLPEGGSKNSNRSNEATLSMNKLQKANGSLPKGSGTDAAKSDDTISSVNSKSSKKAQAYEHLTLSRSSLCDLVKIGRGEFGDVFVGKIKTSMIKVMAGSDKDSESKESSPHSTEKRRSKTSVDEIEAIAEDQDNTKEYAIILVKALIKIKDENICQEFKRQIDMFRKISHRGVVKLYGICQEKEPHYLVLEYTDWGDLKQFLLATAGKINTATSGSIPPLKTGQILAIAYQIARGMDSIYRARFIHKDLATRNCIISSHFIVKISYPALSKDKYNREYFKHRNTFLPIRWLAPECIQEDEYTTKSDIFAFGVLTWELFVQATKIPFENFNNDEFLQMSQCGKLNWECAEETPNDLKEILLTCWNPSPQDRPTFSQLCTALTKSMQNCDKQ